MKRPMQLMGKLKMLKPFKFKEYGEWSDGFVQHGYLAEVTESVSMEIFS